MDVLGTYLDLGSCSARCLVWAAFTTSKQDWSYRMEQPEPGELALVQHPEKRVGGPDHDPDWEAFARLTDCVHLLR